MMRSEIVKRGLERLKYIMTGDRKELTRVEFLLRACIAMIVYTIFLLILFARRDSSFLFFEFSSSIRHWIAFLSFMFVLYIPEYYGKKTKRDKKQTAKRTVTANNHNSRI
jgi:hypothetical protein